MRRSTLIPSSPLVQTPTPNRTGSFILFILFIFIIFIISFILFILFKTRVPDTMNEFIQNVQSILKTAALYEVNGLLALVYVLWANGAGLVAVGACVILLVKAPESQRVWILSVSILVMLAAFVAPAPVPVLMAGMAMAGMVAVLLDQFSPDTLRWRVVGALALYAGAALGYMLYGRYLAGVDATAWAEAIGGQQEAQATLSQGRAFLNTLATWGLWLILPLGYLSLLVEGLLAHPPVGTRPAETISAVRTRGG